MVCKFISTQLNGLNIDNFRLISGGSLIFYIGIRESKTQMTEWRLHVEPAWRLTKSGTFIIGSLDTIEIDEKNLQSVENNLANLRPLVGIAIEDVKVSESIPDLELYFNNGYVFTTFAHSMDGECWELRNADGRRWGMGAANELREWREPSDIDIKCSSS